ncbi:unnamed protein product [Clonostachys rhizophaga]|uniref:Major facilitator superfamily (MFS) profile domain-containing protein n=1 Tax=Clonostachys rhizophaga TaxID=160324 RepID=A0A9N9VXF2_9HYPO|nr:unnamed protein product [Clonostachys rhizophaga]
MFVKSPILFSVKRAQGQEGSLPETQSPSASGTEPEFLQVGWDDGDDDPLCPRSFSKPKKWMIVTIVSMACFCVYEWPVHRIRKWSKQHLSTNTFGFSTAASSIYTSTYQQMEESFGNSRKISVLGLSLFVLGIGCGPLFFSPLSEFFGRRPIYLVAWILYVIWTIPQAVANNIATMLVARFLAAFSGGTFLAVAGGTVGDLFSKDELQYPMAIFTVAPFIGPCIGPTMGGFMNYNTHWRWTYYVMLMWSFALLMAITFLVPETFRMFLNNIARKISWFYVLTAVQIPLFCDRRPRCCDNLLVTRAGEPPSKNKTNRFWLLFAGL